MMPNDPITSMQLASTAGAQLRAAREALGLSQEMVAQQLKLAPRQVRAIEEDDYARLPGRTFVRGFVRNYARLVHLDPGSVMAGLPRVDGTSPLDRPSLTAASRPMAELPVAATVRRNSSTRWLIPIVLVAIVAAAGVYEFTRAPSPQRRAPVATENVAPPPTSAPVGQTTTVLPNPLDNSKAESVGVAPVNTAPTAVAPTNDAVSVAPAAPTTSAATAVAPAAPQPAEATLQFTFKQKSWVEVKDGNGTAIFVQTGAAGTSQTVTGMPPLDVAIGNAAGVGLMFRGQPVDLAAHTHANIARLLLK
jgi:cytoskeleton protein RodZ